MRTKHFIPFLLVIMTFTVLSCKKGGDGDDTPELTQEEQRLLDLGGTSGATWIATSITFDGAPATGFDNFSLTIRGTATSKTYSSVDGDPLFGASGTWSFNGTNINQLLFDGDDDNIFTLSNLVTSTTPATARLTVNFTADGGAAAGTSGLYVLNLQAQ